MLDVAHLLLCFLHANQAASVSWTRYSSLLGFAGSTHPSSSLMSRSRRGSCPKHGKQGSGRGQRHPNEHNCILASSPAHVCLPCYELSTRAKMATCEKMNYELGSNTHAHKNTYARANEGNAPTSWASSLVPYLRVTTRSVGGNTSASIKPHRGYAKVALGYTRADECTRHGTNAYVNNPVRSIYTPIAYHPLNSAPTSLVHPLPHTRTHTRICKLSRFIDPHAKKTNRLFAGTPLPH
jgi:hypothetical protein